MPNNEQNRERTVSFTERYSLDELREFERLLSEGKPDSEEKREAEDAIKDLFRFFFVDKKDFLHYSDAGVKALEDGVVIILDVSESRANYLLPLKEGFSAKMLVKGSEEERSLQFDILDTEGTRVILVEAQRNLEAKIALATKRLLFVFRQKKEHERATTPKRME